jgi:hypothetical protein
MKLSLPSIRHPQDASVRNDPKLRVESGRFLEAPILGFWGLIEEQLNIEHLGKHSTGRMAGRSRKGAHAKRLLLFHIPSPNEHEENESHNEAMNAYGDEIQIGADMAAVEF